MSKTNLSPIVCAVMLETPNLHASRCVTLQCQIGWDANHELQHPRFTSGLCYIHCLFFT